jgi:hypothetical protein
MPARTDLDRLAAARPAVLHRTEDVVDLAEENRILCHILSSSPQPTALEGTRRRARAGRRPVWHRPRAMALGLTSAAAVIVAAVLAVTALVPGSHAPAPTAGHGASGPARLTAWTVSKLADGDVRVQIIKLRDPAALQSKLRAEGVPANVTSSGSPSGACRSYPASPNQLSAVFPGPRARGTTDSGAAAIIVVIDPAALPHGAGVHLGGQFNSALAGAATWNLVHASSGCTGS